MHETTVRTDVLKLRYEVTAIVRQVIGTLYQDIMYLPDRYANRDTIRRNSALLLVHEVPADLKQKLDAAIVNWAHGDGA